MKLVAASLSLAFALLCASSLTRESGTWDEYLLGLGSGRLVLYFSNNERQVVLDHVLFINSKEEQLKNMMAGLRVQIQQPGP